MHLNKCKHLMEKLINKGINTKVSKYRSTTISAIVYKLFNVSVLLVFSVFNDILIDVSHRMLMIWQFLSNDH